MFIAALFIMARNWMPHRCPSAEGWIMKMWYIDALEYCSFFKKNEIVKFVDKWMELDKNILSEVTQTLRR